MAGNGGGLFLSDSHHIVLRSSVVSSNEATNGGAIYASHSSSIAIGGARPVDIRVTYQPDFYVTPIDTVYVKFQSNVDVRYFFRVKDKNNVPGVDTFITLRVNELPGTNGNPPLLLAGNGPFHLTSLFIH